MSSRRCEEEEYIQFLIGTPAVYSCCEAARVQPIEGACPKHDSITRLLHETPEGRAELWEEARPFVDRGKGVLVLDDSTLDKQYAHKIELVSYHWSGKHHRVVKGINVVTLLWTDGDAHIPCDFRVYEKGKETKNDLFLSMVECASARGFAPECVVFDSWYSSCTNLRAIEAKGWKFLTRLKNNRLVNPGEKGEAFRPISECHIDEQGTVVYMKDYGFVKVFRTFDKDGEAEHWATNDLDMDELQRLRFAEFSWTIEEYHRGVKQFCGVERCQVRAAAAQVAHIAFAIRAFLRIERFCSFLGYTWFHAKREITREAVRAYLAHPRITFEMTA